MGEKVSLGYAWYALGVLFMINLINYVDRLSIGPAMECIKRDFSVNDAKMGLIAGSFMLVYAILSLPMGYASDKGRRTAIVALGAAVWSVATTLSGFARGFVGFFFARAAVGAGEGIYAPSGTAIVADYFPKRLRNTSIAIFMSAMIVGGALAYIVAGIILQKTEHFDIPTVEHVVLDEGQKEFAGWNLVQVSETSDRNVGFEFKHSDDMIRAVFSRYDEDKNAATQTRLFNINFTYNGIQDLDKFPPHAEEFMGSLTKRAREREGSIERKGQSLERNEAPILELPHAFVVGEKVRELDNGTEYRLELSPDYVQEKKVDFVTSLWNSFVALFRTKDEFAEEEAARTQMQKNLDTMAEYSDRLFYFEGEIGQEEQGSDFTDVLANLLGEKEVAGDKVHKLIFYGIMTKGERLRLDKLSDNENYSKAIATLHAEAKYHYVKSDNWKWIFWILGPPGLLFAIMAYFLKEPLKGGSEDFLSEEEAKRVEESGNVNYTILIKTPSLVLMVFSNILVTFAVGGLNAWLFPFVERYKGIESAKAAVSFGPIVVLFAVLGVIFSGMAADRLQKRTPRGNNIIIVLGILLGIPPMYVFLHAENYTAMVAAICATIFFLTWVNGPMNALLMSLVEPRLRALLNGIHILLIHLLGDAISPYIIGHQSDVNGLAYALAMLPIVLMIGCVGFSLAAVFVPKDLKAVEKRMKNAAGSGAEDTSPPAGVH